MVRCYYCDDEVRRGKSIGGELAIETVHRGIDSANLEVEVGVARADIGRVELVELHR